jgi:manganese transport system ATP-binding protein
MRKVLMHGTPDVVLQPENLAMAFGLDVLNRDGTGNRDGAGTREGAGNSESASNRNGPAVAHEWGI